MTTLIVKITDGTDIRRFTANVADLTFESVQKRTAEAFGLGVKDLKLQYKDDEGDMVTMSSNDEMLEAIGLATSMVPAVLRLNVSKTTNNPKTTNTTTDTTTNTGGGAPPHDMNDLMQKISAQLPHLVHQARPFPFPPAASRSSLSPHLHPPDPPFSPSARRLPHPSPLISIPHSSPAPPPPAHSCPRRCATWCRTPSSTSPRPSPPTSTRR